MTRYLYVIDEDGTEIPGSRRSLDHCRNWQEIRAIEGQLRASMGEGCEVRDSALDEGRA